MNKETMKQGMIKVLNMYDITYGKEAIDKIINIWADNKAPLMEVLKHHPNWNEDKCYVAFDQNIKGQPDEDKIYNFIEWVIDRTYTTCALDKLRRYKEQLLTKEMADCIKESYPDIKGIAEGQKTSRAVKKICNLVSITPENYSNFERAYAKYSDAINPLDQIRHTILSVNPVDYLLSSNGNSWSSCHTLDKNNPNGYSGCHCSGTMSYLLDGTTMVYYQVDKEYDGNDLEFEPKIIRQLFHYKDGILVQGRLYPQCNDGKNSLYTPIRAQIQKIIADCLVAPNLWKKKGGISACCSVINSEGTHYRDYSCQSECSVSKIVKMIPKGRVDDRRMTVGHDIYCVKCGDYHTMESTLLCEDCYDNYGDSGSHRCCDCGDRYDEDEMYCINGNWYCCDCSTYCDCCNERVPNSEIQYYRELDMDICNSCREEDFTECDCCGRLRNNDDITYVASTDEEVCSHCLEEKYTYIESEDDFFPDRKVKECIHCGKYYVIKEGDKGLLCPDCVEEEASDE